MSDNLTLLNRVQALQDDAQDGQERYPGSAVAFLGVVTTTGMIPTDPNVIFAVNPVRITGPNGEGQTPTLTSVGSRIFAANMGKQAPGVGEYVLVTGYRGRYSFIFNG